MKNIKPISNSLVYEGSIIAYFRKEDKTIILDRPDLLTEIHLLYPEWRINIKSTDVTPDCRKNTQ